MGFPGAVDHLHHLRQEGHQFALKEWHPLRLNQPKHGLEELVVLRADLQDRRQHLGSQSFEDILGPHLSVVLDEFGEAGGGRGLGPFVDSGPEGGWVEG